MCVIHRRFEVSMRILYPDPVDFITALGFANMIWSRLEPSAYMASITADPLPDTPTHRVPPTQTYIPMINYTYVYVYMHCNEVVM